jgi:hypothetical protein
MKRLIKRVVNRLRKWLDDGQRPHAAPDGSPIPFDNSYEWLDASFRRLMADPVCARRPQYVWGVLDGAALAKVLGLEGVSVIEFGVASGAGLVALERVAERAEQLIGIRIEVFGFDTGTGHPKPRDYRDMPYRWFEGYYPCDKEQLEKRLTRARMIYGLVAETVGSFIRDGHPPVAFVGWDFSVYTATRDALSLFGADSRALLPRTPCSFRSAIGKDNCEYTGELLAISEFNAAHEMRKICKIQGMRYFVPAQYSGHWMEWLHTMHIFDHPLYNAPQSYSLSAVIDIDGRETSVQAKFGANIQSARSSEHTVRKSSQ